MCQTQHYVHIVVSYFKLMYYKLYALSVLHLNSKSCVFFISDVDCYSIFKVFFSCHEYILHFNPSYPKGG